jgi:hypothetical protein
MEIELRRRRTTLSILGMGIICFGIWDVVKTLLYIWMGDDIIDLPDIPPEYEALALVIAIVLVALVVLFDLWMRLYLGLSARAESFGEKKGSAYIVLAALLFAGNLLSLVMILLGRLDARLENQSELDYCVSLFVDCTSASMLGELLYNAIRIRVLERRLEG